MLDVASRSSVFLGGSKLTKFDYSSVNLPYISMSAGVSNFTDEYLQQVLQNLVLFKNITVYPDSSNVINMVAIHVADGVYVKKGNQTLCYDSKAYDVYSSDLTTFSLKQCVDFMIM
jgi:hypothetical protein